MFTLNERLQADTHFVADLSLCKLLMMNDASYPWFILVPMREDAREISDLLEDDQALLLREINVVSSMLQQVFEPYKLNVAALGNVVEQLHVHIVGRFKEDKAWPAPVWGHSPAEPYSLEVAEEVLRKVKEVLSGNV